ncbi:MAG: DUF4347 domain-containing protein [Cyanobacteria bacterium P01_A01_bin.37]
MDTNQHPNLVETTEQFSLHSDLVTSSPRLGQVFSSNLLTKDYQIEDPFFLDPYSTLDLDDNYYSSSSVFSSIEPNIRDLTNWQTKRTLNTDFLESDSLVNDIADDYLLRSPYKENPSKRNEIIFVDQRVDDYQHLLVGTDPDAEIIIIDADTDGMSQINVILSKRTQLDAIHIVSHGESNKLQIGSTQLSSENLDAYAHDLQRWSGSLTEEADILLYGCNLAKDGVGKVFIEHLSTLTGADVAASDDLTGSHRLGGDWDLEVTTGSIETAIAFSGSVIENYHSTLAVLIGNQTIDDTTFNENVTISGDVVLNVTGDLVISNIAAVIGDGIGSLDNLTIEADGVVTIGGLMGGAGLNNISIEAKEINVLDNITISSRHISGQNFLTGQSISDSGDISFSAAQITLGEGASLLTHTETESGFQAGDISLTAIFEENKGGEQSNGTDDEGIEIKEILSSSDVVTEINLDSATLLGSNVTIDAQTSLTVKAEGRSGDVEIDGVRVAATSAAQVNIQGRSRIESSGDLKINASSTVNATAFAEAKSNGDSSLDAAVALANVNNSAIASISGNSKVAVGGELALNAKTETNVTNTADGAAGGGGAVGATVAISTIDITTEAYIDGRVSIAQSGTIAVEATAIENISTQSTSTEGGAKDNSATTKKRLSDNQAATSEGNVEVAAAIAVADVTRQSQAYVATDGTIKTDDVLDIRSTSSIKSDVNADGTATKGNVGVGVGVGINQVDVSNNAYLGGNANITAKQVNLEATTGDNQSEFTTSSASGAGSDTVGVAGALALNRINKHQNQVAIRENADVNVNGADVNLLADSHTKQVTKALPKQEENNSSDVGIGASVAISVTKQRTEALVQNNAQLKNARNLNLSANSLEDSEIKAAGGAEGDVAIDVSGAISDLTQTTEATIAAGEQIVTQNGITVSSYHRSKTVTEADGSVSGDTVGVGASVAVVTSNSQTNAKVERGVETVDGILDITADSTRTYKTTAKASAKGADTEKSKQGQSKSGQSLNDYGARTSEGAVDVAAAVAVSDIKDHATATISNGTFEIAGDINLNTVNRTGLATKGDGSAKKGESTVKVGVGVAINTTSNTTKAWIGENTVVAEAKDINVKAASKQNVAEKNESGETDDAEEYKDFNQFNDKFGVEAIAGASKGDVGVAGSLAISRSTDQIHASIADGVVITSAEDVTLQSSDTSRLAAKAHAQTSDSDVGVGASVAILSTNRQNQAFVGQGAAINANSLFVKATNHRIDPEKFDFKDFKNVATNLTGLLRTNNYYTEAIAGSTNTGKEGGTVQVAGSFVVNDLNNTTESWIGQGATIKTTSDLSLSSTHDVQSKAIAGNLAFDLNGEASVGIGSVDIIDTATTQSFIQSGTSITSSNIQVDAQANQDLATFGISLAAAPNGIIGFGGVANVVKMNHQTKAFIANSELGQPTTTISADSLNLNANSTFDLINIAGAAAGGSTAGVGVSAAVNTLENITQAHIGEFTKADIAGATDINATHKDNILAIAAGAGGAETFALAGSAVVTEITNTTTASINPFATLNQATAAATNQTISINASDTTTYIGTGGAVAIAGTAGISGGVDILSLNKDTQAFAGSDTSTKANDSITIRALSEEDIASVSASIGAAGTAGIAASVGVSTLSITTKAFIGDRATAYAEGNILVDADVQTEADIFAGGASVGGTAGIGASVGVPIIEKDTSASIGTSADVTAKGLRNYTSVKTGKFVVGYEENASDSMEVGGPRVQLTKLVSKSGDEAEAEYGDEFPDLEFRSDQNHIIREFGSWEEDGFKVNQEVQISDASQNEGIYKIIDIKDDGKTLVLEPTQQLVDETIDGPNITGTLITGAIEIQATVAQDNSEGATVSRENNAIAQQRTSSAEEASMKGLAVTATNQDDLESYAISGAAAGTVAIAVAGNINVLNNQTTARIEDGAIVNQNNAGASADQSVVVAAGSDLYHMGINGSAAFAGAVGVAPAAGVAIFSNTTEAFIGNPEETANGTQVYANGDVQVSARSKEDILSIGIGVGISGTVSIGGSVSVISIDNTTTALIGDGSMVQAGGDILVDAKDYTNIDVVSGAAGIGILGGGVGASVGVVLVDKDTQAYIGQDAIVDAGANSSSPLPGISGLSDIGPDPNFQTESLHGISVQAQSSEDIFNLAVAGGGGLFVGIAGAVTVDIIDSDTHAHIGESAQINQNTPLANNAQSVRVSANNDLDLLGVSGSAALGLVALSGGVDVGIVRNDTSAQVHDGAVINTQQDVTVQAQSTKDIDSYAISGTIGGFVGVAGAVAVHSIGGNPLLNLESEEDNDGNTESINILGTKDEDGNENGDVQGFADQESQGSELFKILTNREKPPSNSGNNEEPVQSQDFDDSDSRINKAILGANTASAERRDENIDGEVVSKNVSEDAESDDTDTPGTTATIGQNVGINTGDDISVIAEGQLDFDITVGATAVAGIVGAGGSVAVSNVAENVQATVEDSALLSAEDDINVKAAFNETLDGRGFAGGAGLVGLGAQVVIINDKSSQRASVGNNTEIIQADNIEVSAIADKTVAADSTGGAVGAVAIGVSIARVNAKGETAALVGDGVQIGQTEGQHVNNLVVKANQATALDSEALGVSVGVISGRGAVAESIVSPETKVIASIGDDTDINLNQDAIVTANSQADADSFAKGVGGGAFDVGLSKATSELNPFIDTKIGNGAEITTGGDIVITANHGVPLDISDGSFNLSQVNSATNTITFDKPHGLGNGSTVDYSNEGGKSIGGLEDGSSYNVIPISDNEIKLGDRFNGSNVDTERNTITFDVPHGFEDGDEVVYENIDSASVIDGLMPGRQYFVRTLDEDSIQLFDTKDKARKDRVLNQDSIDFALDEIGFRSFFGASNHNFETGQQITYRVVSESGDDDESNPAGTDAINLIQGLGNGGTYYIIKINDTLFKLASSFNDALNGIAIDLEPPKDGNQQVVELDENIRFSIVPDESINLTSSSPGNHDLYFDIDPSTASGEEHRLISSGNPLGLLGVVADEDISSATATGSSGKLVGGEASKTDISVTPTVRTLIGDNSSLSAGGDVEVDVTSSSNATAFATNKQGAGIAKGGAKSDLHLFNKATSLTGSNSSIDAKGDIFITSNSFKLGRSAAEAKAIAGVSVVNANAKTDVNHATEVILGTESSIFSEQDLTVDASSTTNVDAQGRASAGGLGASAKTKALINSADDDFGEETNTLLTQVRVNPNLRAKASNVLLSAEVKEINATAIAKSVGNGAGKSETKAETTILDSLADIEVQSGASLTGAENLELSAQHTNVDTHASGKALLRGPGKRKADVTHNQITTSSITTERDSQIRTKNLLVQAGGFADADSYNFETDSKARGLLGKRRENTNQATNRLIDFNSNISPGATPVLEVDEDANVTKACNVTIDDTDGQTLGPVVADRIFVNDISNDESMTATFRISELPEDESGKNGNTGIGLIKGEPRFLETYDYVKIKNQSDKDIVINDIDVINTTIPIIIVQGAQPSEREEFFAIENEPLGENIPRLLGPTVIDILNLSSSDVILNGIIANPHDTTNINNTGSDILSAHLEAGIESRVLNLTSDQGHIGTKENRVTTRLIQGYAIGEGYELEGKKLRDPSLQPDIVLTSDANKSIYLDLQGIRQDEESLVIHADRISTNTDDVDLKIQQGINGDRTLIPSTYEFGLIQSGGDIILDAGRSDTTINGNTDILATGKLDVVTGNDIDLSEIGGHLDIRQVHSDTGDITLTVEDSVATGEDLILDSEATVNASEGDVTLRAGDDIVMAREATVTANDTVSLEGDYGNADQEVGTKSFIRGIIDALKLRFTGNADGDRVDLTEARYTESIIDLQDGDDVFAGGSSPDHVEGGDGNDSINGHGGDDQLDGNAGIDTLSGGAGSDTLNGGAGNDTLNGEEDGDRLIGGEGNDALNGGEGDDTLEGQNGKDTLVGNEGNDRLSGGDDRDILRGDDGDDHLDGGADRDILIGGQGTDEFPGDAQDIERDFDETVDVRTEIS